MQKHIPARPSLEQYKKQAKELVKNSASMKLAEAQWRIAQEHGFKTWAEFKNHIEEQAAIEIVIPKPAEGLVLMPFVSSSGRFHPRHRLFAEVLQRAGFGTVLADLLSEDEELADIEKEELRHDIRLMASRVVAVAESLQTQGLKLGYLGFEMGAAAVLLAAAERPDLVNAVVSSRGRHDLAGPWLAKVEAPCLFVVDVNDRIGVGFQANAMQGLSPSTLRMYQIVDVPEKSIALACDWFRWHLATKEGAR
jgi:pimeloyl-ACP methyl ester carboxylesterase